MNEAETRAELIDPALKAAGWGVTPDSRVRREEITKGLLIGEYDGSGNALKETVWFGNLPVAVMTSSALYQLDPDNLGAPHIITDQTGNQI